MPEEKPQDSTLNKIAASSVALSDCAASIRSRLLAQRETLDRLRTELAAMRSIAGIPPASAPAPATPPPAEASPVEAPLEERPASPAHEVHRFPKAFTVHTFPTVESASPEAFEARPVPPIEPAAEPAVESLDAALDKLISQQLPAPEAVPAAPEPVVESAFEPPAIAETPSDEPKTASSAIAPDPAGESFESILAKFASEPLPAPAAATESAAPEPVLTPMISAAPSVPEPVAAEPVLTSLFAVEPPIQPASAPEPEAPPPHVEPIVQPLEPTLVIAPLPAAESAVQEAAVAETAAPESAAEPTLSEPILESIVPETAASKPAVHPQSSVIIFKVPRAMVLIGLPVICLIGAFIVLARFQAPVRVARPKAAEAPPPPVVGDPKADEAIALAQGWHITGDEKSVFERLGAVDKYPGGAPAWSAEMTDDDSYLVVFREADGTAYAFETNLKNKTVQPTPEAVDRLTLMRVRDAAAKLNAR